MTKFGFFNPYVPDHPNHAPEVLLAIDFETCSDTDFFAVGAVVASYPDGAILEQFEASAFRELRLNTEGGPFMASQFKFWAEHANIKQQLDYRSQQSQDTEAVKWLNLARFVRAVHVKYPKLRIVGDNLTLDMRMINNLLIAQGLPVISIRENGNFIRPICSITFQSTVLAMCGARGGRDSIQSFHEHVFSAFYIKEFFQTHHGQQTLVSLVNRDLDRMNEYHGSGNQHIPLADCARVLSQYCQARDLVRFFQRFSLKPQRLSSLRVQALFEVSPLVSIPEDSASGSADGGGGGYDDEERENGIAAKNNCSTMHQHNSPLLQHFVPAADPCTSFVATVSASVSASALSDNATASPKEKEQLTANVQPPVSPSSSAMAGMLTKTPPPGLTRCTSPNLPADAGSLFDVEEKKTAVSTVSPFSASYLDYMKMPRRIVATSVSTIRGQQGPPHTSRSSFSPSSTSAASTPLHPRRNHATPRKNHTTSSGIKKTTPPNDDEGAVPGSPRKQPSTATGSSKRRSRKQANGKDARSSTTTGGVAKAGPTPPSVCGVNQFAALSLS